MKKIFILMLIFMLPIIYAPIDFTIKPALEGDMITSIINPTAVNGSSIDRGFLFLPLTAPGVADAGGLRGPGPAKKVVATFYDVIVELDKDKYTVDDIVHAKITIINKGSQEDRDGVLTSYMLDPSGQRWRLKNITFALVPPTCPNGDLIQAEPTFFCKYENGTRFAPFVWMEERNMSLPMNASLGEWSFNVEYQTPIQPLIKSSVPFEVFSKLKNLWVIIFLIFLIGVAVYTRRSRRKAEKEGEERENNTKEGIEREINEEW